MFEPLSSDNVAGAHAASCKRRAIEVKESDSVTDSLKELGDGWSSTQWTIKDNSPVVVCSQTIPKGSKRSQMAIPPRQRRGGAASLANMPTAEAQAEQENRVTQKSTG